MRKWVGYPLLQGAAIGLAGTLCSALLYTTGALDWIERPIWDWQVRTLAAPGSATPLVQTIMIDQNSLDFAQDPENFGIGWPWPRQVYAYILEFCKRAGVKALVFDMLYTEHSVYGVADDELFGSAIAGGPPSIFALPLGQTLGSATFWVGGASDPLPPADRISGFTPEHISDASLPRAAFPIPEVASTATLLGNVTAQPDADAVFRRVAPYRVFDNRFVPLLGLGAVLAADPTLDIRRRNGALEIGNKVIPLDRNGNAILRFRGPTQTHTVHSAAAILQSEARLQAGEAPLIDPSLLQDAWVILGVTAPGLMDLKPTPVGKTYPGLEIHATFLDNFLSGDFIRETPPLAAGLFVMLTGLLAGMVVRGSRRSTLHAADFPLFMALPTGMGFAAYAYGYWLPVAPAFTAALLAMISAVITNYALEGRQKRFIKNAFKQYLSPVVIEKLVENPDRLTLGGEEKTLSIFFSDVQGFTSISEKLSPSELTSLLNEYLTAMTDIIHETGGTIDKYEGDAIIAFWNAPLEQTDHAARAVHAALLCQKRLSEMRADLHARYGSELFVRIGINTGPVVVGNMGSNQRFDYTFLGDAGNLAARLEGINKQFGTYLLVSGNTCKALNGAFPAREISRVRVVGKSVPITIFEPMLQEVAEERKILLDAFASALQSYYDGHFDAAGQTFIKLAKDDTVSGIYANRCKTLATAPPDGWEGIWNLTEK